jgi:hypothetical protein
MISISSLRQTPDFREDSGGRKVRKHGKNQRNLMRWKLAVTSYGRDGRSLVAS